MLHDWYWIAFLTINTVEEAAEKASTDNHTQDEWFHYLRCSTPETVLALLDELEKMQAQSSKWCEAFHKAVSVGARYEERIAELERKEQHSERQSVIDALAGSGEEWSDIEEYMQKWDAERASAAGKGE